MARVRKKKRTYKRRYKTRTKFKKRTRKLKSGERKEAIKRGLVRARTKTERGWAKAGKDSRARARGKIKARSVKGALKIKSTRKLGRRERLSEREIRKREKEREKDKMQGMVHTQDIKKVIPSGTILVSSGGRIWYKGYKQYGTFGSSTEARQKTVATYDRKGNFTGLTTKSEAKGAAEYWWQKQRQRKRELSRKYRAALALEQAAAAKSRAEFITGEKSAIETEMQRRYTLLGRRRRGSKSAALTKSRREAWGKKLAESRRYEGETWFGKIPSILGTSQAASPSRGRRMANRILRELNGTTRRKSPKRAPTRKKTGGQVL